METSLKAIVRDNTRSAQSRRSRGEGSIPAVVYGFVPRDFSLSFCAGFGITTRWFGADVSGDTECEWAACAL